MRMPVFLTSPLAGTAAVCVGLAALAVPLHRLTSAPPVVAAPVMESAEASVAGTPAVLRLKLLAPAAKVTVASPDGTILLDLADIPAGESEHDVKLPLNHNVGELDVCADFGGSAAETAVFITIMPDGMEERVCFITGSGRVRDVLRFEWPHEHD
jgi:hypothetical protein